MKPSTRLILPSIVIGAGMAALFQVLALVAYERGFIAITKVLDWPNTLLQSATPCPSPGTAADPACPGSPTNLIAYFGSLPLGAAAYTLAAYAVLRRRLGRSS